MPPNPKSAMRETVEAVAVAFVLAFVFRTFVAEAFVIPTGSMSPSLLGAHKEVTCQECGTSYRVNSSADGATAAERRATEAVAGKCPCCRRPMVFDPNFVRGAKTAGATLQNSSTFPGDRIVVSKFQYSFADPQRWDVVVFKFPGQPSENYIKRLVGLPGETLQVYQGDLFAKHGDGKFTICRKPTGRLAAMLQPVFDTDHDSTRLADAEWPTRFAAEDGSPWRDEPQRSGNTMSHRYTVSPTPATRWLRYSHRVAPESLWRAIDLEGPEVVAKNMATLPRPAKLIEDFNSYNTRLPYGAVSERQRAAQGGRFAPELVLSTEVDPTGQGIHWVGDLVVEAVLAESSAAGELALEVTEAGHRFAVVLDLATGSAQLAIHPWQSTEPLPTFRPQATTKLAGGGAHRVKFGNVDDELVLWVDGRRVEFDSPTTFDWEQLLGPRSQIRPQTSDTSPGDLAPVAIGARNATLTIDRIRVFRDIYYIACREMTRVVGGGIVATDLPQFVDPANLYDPQRWDRFEQRRSEEFNLTADQFFVMGDNSPASSDCRLWSDETRQQPTRERVAGGPYLERHLLIGRAVWVMWPRALYKIPGTPIPLVPNFPEMRLIR